MMSHSNPANGPPSANRGQGQGQSSEDTTSSPPLGQIELKWTSHQPTIFNIFQDLYNSEHLVDVTLTAEGKYLRAHKIILSACSPYFQELLSLDCSTKHPILFMSPGVKFDELKAILNYMYKGEARIPQENLPSLLQLAESLQIRGLAETENPSPSPVPQTQPEQRHQQNWPTHSSNSTSTGISVKTGIGNKRKTGQSFNQPPIVTDPNTSSSFPLDISTTNSTKRFRVDPIMLMENQNPIHQNVETTTILPTTVTSYDETQVYSDVGGQGQGIPEVNINVIQEGRIHSHPHHQMFEMEDVQIIEDHEIKVEVDGNMVSGGDLLDESNSCGRPQSVDEEEEGNCWNILRSGGHQQRSHLESDFQIPSTSSSYQGQLDRGGDTEEHEQEIPEIDQEGRRGSQQFRKLPLILDGRYFAVTSCIGKKVSAKCLKCISSKQICGSLLSTSNFLKHLQRVHKDDYNEFEANKKKSRIQIFR